MIFLRRLGLVQGKKVEPDTLCHIYTRRLYVKVCLRVHLQVEVTYSCPHHLLSLTNQNRLFPRGNLPQVVHETRVTGNVVGGPVIGYPYLTTR